MTDRWQQVRALFERAVELEPFDRSRYLEQACDGDPSLAAEVNELLFADDATESDLMTPEAVSGFLRSGLGDALAGTRIGSFRLVRSLASGGMGTVYEAEQESPRRTVAVKVLNASLWGKADLRRFEYEAEALGRVAHPGIAQVFDSGVAELGDPGAPLRVPYIAMELVEGARDLFAHAEELDLDDRLRLFGSVADAVQHAHERGVIHRDLKAGNLLVDRAGRTKVIDFGIARTSEGDVEQLTRTGLVLGTLGTMAPEQLDGTGADVRADVYSLGAVLYHLVADRPALELQGLSLPDAAERIRDRVPARPSSLRPELPRELDWIVARALEKDRERRYGSVAELAADVRRFLDHEPLAAGPPSARYRARIFVRKHRLLVTSLLVVIAVLTVGIALTSWGLVRAMRAEGVAEERTADAEQRASTLQNLNDFLEDLLTSPAAEVGGHDVRVVDMLDVAADEVGVELGDQAPLEAAMRGTLASAYAALGVWEAALEQCERGLAADGRAGTGDDTLEGSLQRVRLNALVELGRFEEVVAEARPLAEAGLVDELGAELLTGRALIGLYRFARAEGHLRAALELAGDGGQRADVAVAHIALSDVLVKTERPGEALEHARAGLDIRRELFGADTPKTLAPEIGLALVEIAAGRPDEAADRIERQIVLFEDRFGAAHPWMQRARANLVGALAEAGRTEDALWTAEEGLEAARAAFPEAHPDVLRMLESRATALFFARRPSEAADTFGDCLDLARQVFGEGHVDVQALLNAHLHTLRAAGREDEVVPAARAAWERARERLGGGHDATIKIRARYAEALRDGGAFAEAIEQWTAVLEVMREASERNHELEAVLEEDVRWTRARLAEASNEL